MSRQKALTTLIFISFVIVPILFYIALFYFGTQKFCQDIPDNMIKGRCLITSSNLVHENGNFIANITFDKCFHKVCTSNLQTNISLSTDEETKAEYFLFKDYYPGRRGLCYQTKDGAANQVVWNVLKCQNTSVFLFTTFLGSFGCVPLGLVLFIAIVFFMEPIRENEFGTINP